MKLAACGSRSLALEAWGLELSSFFIFLVFRIRDIGDLPVPAASPAAALVALILGRAGLSLGAHSAGPRPPGRILTIHHMAG